MPPAVYAQTPAVGMPKGQPLSVIQRRPGVNNRSRQRQREKKPRERTVYTDWQMNKLISYYEKNPRPTTQEKEAYAEELSVPKKKVSVWFQNRRCKDKKKQEIEERLEIAVQQDQRREEEKAQANQQPPFLPANLTPHLPQKEYNENEHLGTGPIEVFPVSPHFMHYNTTTVQTVQSVSRRLAELQPAVVKKHMHIVQSMKQHNVTSLQLVQSICKCTVEGLESATELKLTGIPVLL